MWTYMPYMVIYYFFIVLIVIMFTVVRKKKQTFSFAEKVCYNILEV